jgi:hypothetical protein
LLTLYTTPVIYLAMERLKVRLTQWRSAMPPVARRPGEVPGPAE